MEKEFEDFWTAHSKQLIARAPKRWQEERTHSLGMNTLGDWLLWIVPVGVVVCLMDYKFVASSLVNFLILLVICVVCVVVCQMVRPYVTGKRSVAEIDKEIKQYYYEQYRRDGKIEL
ncbi:hypothetical protein CIK94_00740 [Prevotella sp. P4-51]|jgi:uncharacterized membrane protein|uniref:hypothetical protein n=1 Tax=Prevotella TaxID=838 RepID=UPI000B95D54E|nr:MULTISPECIES: hypothetical protein [Prevotella]MEE0620577.1 hypothetical protein [Prevotella sp.]MCF2635860.1 hypothetical protein [Prevotella dentalis]OYP64599.1 hypothetical protein CIK95_06110 [Prevotella sp. P5-108]OYP72410.1 hypothetical protein CIK92_06220 [Prevotella sp. P4-67]OYP79174.1 hypothetical protein CIK94_00740 [Prevotella sp. P4-51]